MPDKLENYKDYHDAGMSVRKEGLLLNGEHDGLWRWHYEEGQLETEILYYKGRKIWSKAYSEDGEMLSYSRQGRFINKQIFYPQGDSGSGYSEAQLKIQLNKGAILEISYRKPITCRKAKNDK